MRTRTLAALTLCLLCASAAAAVLPVAAAAPAASPDAAALSAGSPAASSSAHATADAHALDTAGPRRGPDDAAGSRAADYPATGTVSQSGAPPEAATLAAAQGTNFTRPLTIELRMRDDGDARVILRKEYPLDTDAHRGAFEQTVDEFEAGRQDLGAEAIQAVVDDVAEQSDRSMAVTDYDSVVDEDDGVIEERFTWQNFGTATGERVVVDDGFYDADGPWLRVLTSNARLVLRSPEGYRVEDSSAGVTGDAVVWEVEEGTTEYEFSQDEFRTVFVESEGIFDLGSGALLAVGLLLLGLGVGGYLLVRWTDLASTGQEPTAADESGLPGAPEGGTGDASGSTDQAAASGGAGAAAAAEGDDEDHDDGVDPELLSDEERVERLLQRNGGRMKQANIVEETGWSNAKVSQLLSEMAENDRVDKLRIGRENLITLPDEDVTATE